ncbi:MAG: hypothetical protein ACLP59_02295 [Bryobacteraceae bacterium]
MRVTGILLGACLLLYGGLTAGVYWAMCQPLDRFGAIMQRVPGVAMAVLPFEPLWMRVRAGLLHPGDLAPDFDLPLVDHSRRIRISEVYRAEPLVLIFGSYS